MWELFLALPFGSPSIYTNVANQMKILNVKNLNIIIIYKKKTLNLLVIPQAQFHLFVQPYAHSFAFLGFLTSFQPLKSSLLVSTHLAIDSNAL
jgi:hypothetical protein